MSQNHSLSSRQLPRLTKSERARLKVEQQRHDSQFIYDGVDFSKISLSALIERRDIGEMIEFEALGPYMTDYQDNDFVISSDVLVPEDAIGLELAVLFGKLFPRARLVSLYDDYNATHATEDDGTTSAEYSSTDKQKFRESLDALFLSAGVPVRERLLISESDKVVQAQRLVAFLDTLDMIERRDQEIIFVPRDPENPLYSRITLRTKRGKWLCAALDAAGFLGQQNQHITHLIVLPDYMKEQQDKVWEILRVLSLSPDQYHNIFYDPKALPRHVCQVVAAEFKKATSSLANLQTVLANS